MEEENTQSLERFIEMVQGSHICMMLIYGKNGEELSGRPMGVNKVDANGTMWFFTKRSSQKADVIDDNGKVAIAIVNESNNNYLMIHGESSLSDDRLKMKDLWTPLMKAWFPLGLEEQDMVLIKVVPTEVNYWDSKGGQMVVLFNMLKAVVTGKVYNEGEHGKIALEPQL